MAEPNELIVLADELAQAISGKGDLTVEALIEVRGADIVEGLRQRAQELAAWPNEWLLREPVEVLGETYHRLPLREPNADEYLKFGFLDSTVTGEKMLQLISAVSGKPLPVIKKMPGFDVARLTRQIGRFFSLAAA